LLEDWGVAPEQVVDLQAIVGDSVDNIKGVPGIGIKTGAKLLQEFGTLENLLANIDKVQGAKKQESLRACGEIVALSRQLVRLATDVPIKEDWEAWKVQPMDVDRLMTLCREWGFHGIANQIRAQGKSTGPVQGELFGDEMFPFGANAPATPVHHSRVEKEDKGAGTSSLAGSRSRLVTEREPASDVPSEPQRGEVNAKWNATYTLIDTPEAFKSLVAELKKQPRFAIDLETTSLMPLEAEIVGIALCWKPGEAYYLALRGPDDARVLDTKAVLKALRPLLEDPKKAKVNQNIKYDLLVLRGKGIELQGIASDSMVADYLLHAGQRVHNLEDLSKRYLDHQVITITELIGKKSRKQPQLRMDQVPTDKVCHYAAEDADVAWRLMGILEEKLNKLPQLRQLYDELEVPLIDVLAEMEFNGIRLDVELLNRVSVEMGEQLAAIEKEIYSLAGHEFNIGSLPQLRKVLFDELKLPVQGRTGVTGEPSTDQENLEKLAALKLPGAALPKKILEHRQINKLKGTYVDALPTMVYAPTKRIHASFNQTVAATGRLSSSDPNLQNIPVRREMGQQIRQAFLAEPGCVLLTADYSQIELRLFAHFCQDEELSRAFAEDLDIHAAVASQIFHAPIDKVTSEQRGMAKTVNFGILYGMSAGGLAQRLQISKTDAEAFITAYFKRYPRVEAYQKKLLDDCRKNGYVTTILGRRRTFDPTAIRSHSSYQNRNQAEREAINTEVQGSAADLIKLAMLHVYRRLRKEKLRARLLLQIHDELVFEAPKKELAKLAELVRYEMTEPPSKRLGLRVPLRIDYAAGPNWLDVESLEEEGKK
jgi:DNA polymerase-1